MMMNIEQLLLAKKYAIAFLNIFEDVVDFNTYQAIEKMLHFFKHNRQAIVVLTMPNLEIAAKLELLEKIVDFYHAPKESVMKLASLLIKQQRLLLFPSVLLQIVRVYRERNQLASFTFCASHELSHDETAILSQFLAQKINKNILYNAVIDKELIAGIRLQSDTWLWEYSVEKQLRAIEHSLYQ